MVFASFTGSQICEELVAQTRLPLAGHTPPHPAAACTGTVRSTSAHPDADRRPASRPAEALTPGNTTPIRRQLPRRRHILDPSTAYSGAPELGQFSEHLEPGQGDEDCLAPFEGSLPAGVALQHDLAGRHLDDPAPGTLRGTR